MKSFVFGFLCAGVLFTALHYQFIRTNDDVLVLRKAELGFVNTVVDIRKWSAGDFLKNPDITKKLASHGIGKIVDEAMALLPKPEGEAAAGN